MGTISVQYNKKPSVVDAFKMDMSLPIIDFNVEHVEGKEYAIYSACKYKDQVVAVIGLIRYDYLNKQVFIKIMDETVHPFYYDIYELYMTDWRIYIIKLILTKLDI